MHTIDDPKLAVLSFLSGSLKTHNIATSKRLRNSKTDKLLPRKYIRDDFGFKLIAAKVQNGWQTNNFSTEKAWR